MKCWDMISNSKLCIPALCCKWRKPSHSHFWEFNFLQLFGLQLLADPCWVFRGCWVTGDDFCHFKSSHSISPRDWNMSNLRTAMLGGWVREIIEFGFKDNTQAIYPARSWGEAALCGLDSSQFTPVVSVLFYWQSLNHKCLWVVCGQQAFIF